MRELLEQAQRKIANMLARGTIAAVDDATQLQSLQVELLADELQDGVENFGSYGFTSVPHPGAEVVAVFPNGTRGHALVVAVGDRRYRMRGLKSGEVALHDDQGQRVLLGRDGIEIVTAKELTLRADKARVEARELALEGDAVTLGRDEAKPIARIGDRVVNGVITSGSTKVMCA